MSPNGFNPAEFRAPIRLVEIRKTQSELEGLISHFDQEWQREGLPQDWYRLRGIGFNIDSEMKMLTDRSIPLEERVNQSERNQIGFVVEYLQGGHVYPIDYEIRQDAGGAYLYDPRYKKRMINTASEKERNGSVRQALRTTESFLVSKSTPKGAMALDPSPLGSTGGLRDNDGDLIYYPDSYFFVFQKKNERQVVGFGLRTDLTLLESREVIKRFTGRDLPQDAPIEDYVRAVALISPDQGISSAREVIDVLRDSREGAAKDFAYKNQGWGRIYRDIDRREELYQLELQADGILNELKKYILSGDKSEIELQKAVAATILRLSKHYLIDKKGTTVSGDRYSVDGNIIRPDRFNLNPQSEGGAYGKANEEAQKIDGCAGGNKTTAIESVVNRLGLKKRDWNFDKDGTCQMCKTPLAKLGPCGVCEQCNDKIDAKEEMGLAA